MRSALIAGDLGRSMSAAHPDNTQTAGHGKGQGLFRSWALHMNKGTVRGDYHH